MGEVGGEFLLADGGEGEEELAVALGAVEQKGAEEQELPFSADDLDGLFDGAGLDGLGGGLRGGFWSGAGLGWRHGFRIAGRS